MLLGEFWDQVYNSMPLTAEMWLGLKARGYAGEGGREACAGSAPAQGRAAAPLLLCTRPAKPVPRRLYPLAATLCRATAGMPPAPMHTCPSLLHGKGKVRARQCFLTRAAVLQIPMRFVDSTATSLLIAIMFCPIALQVAWAGRGSPPMLTLSLASTTWASTRPGPAL